MTIKTIKENNQTWINIEQVDEEALLFLKQNYNFHQLDLEDIQSEVHTPKIDIYKNYLFLVLHFPEWNHQGKKVEISKIDFFVGDGFVITVYHGKNKEIKNFFYRCLKNHRTKSDWMGQSSGYLLYHIIESLFHESRAILNNIGKHVSLMEDEIFANEQRVETIKELAIHRRNILTFRRIIDPERYLISNLSHIRKPFLDETLSLYFDDVRDYLDQIWAIIESYKDTIQGLHTTVESLINQRTNRVISILTVISVALLPLNLLASIYGMNIDSLPFAHKPLTILGIFSVVLVVILLTIIVARNRK